MNYYKKILGAIVIFAAGFCFAQVDDDVKELIESQSAFSFSLHAVLEEDDRNLFFSPFSIADCLSMVYCGAQGHTAEELARALHIGRNSQHLAKTYGSLHKHLTTDSSLPTAYRFHNANSLWTAKQIYLLSEFQHQVIDLMGSHLSSLDVSKPIDTIEVINKWICTKTDGKIPNLLKGDDVTADTRLILTNAVSFQGSWLTPFNPTNTRKSPFFVKPDLPVLVDMMSQTTYCPHYRDGVMQMIVLPFASAKEQPSKMALAILMPHLTKNLHMITSSLQENWSRWCSALKGSKIALSIPKFSLRRRFDLADPLKKLGMTSAFDDSANFSGIGGLRDTYLSKVIHEAFCSLDEKGMTAAAATASVSNPVSCLPSTTAHFTANRPFIFLIFDQLTQEIFFIGKFVKPADHES